MSDFVFLFRSTEESRLKAVGTPEQAQRTLQAWLGWIRELEAKGYLKDPGQPLEPGGKVVTGKPAVVTDGPYTEAKDLVLGFIVVQARDLAHAAEIAAGCPIVVGGGSTEVRPVMKGLF
jgi:hypothetical protein